MTMRVTIRGKVYNSVQEAADNLGVTKWTVYTALRRDTVDRVGVGAGKGSRPNWRGGRPKVAVRVAGIDFESMAALAAYIGKDRRYVSQVFRVRGEESRRNLEAMVFHAKAEEERRAWGQRMAQDERMDKLLTEEQKEKVREHRRIMNERRLSHGMD